MGKRKIEMKKVEDRQKLFVHFSKRRKGLFSKASQLSTLCGAHVAIVGFSPTGKSFSFGTPSVDSVVHRFLANTTALPDDHGHDQKEEREDLWSWWDRFNIEDYDSVEKLSCLSNDLDQLRESVISRLNNLPSSSSARVSPSTTAGVNDNDSASTIHGYGFGDQTLMSVVKGSSAPFIPTHSVPVETVVSSDHSVDSTVEDVGAGQELSVDDYYWDDDIMEFRDGRDGSTSTTVVGVKADGFVYASASNLDGYNVGDQDLMAIMNGFSAPLIPSYSAPVDSVDFINDHDYFSWASAEELEKAFFGR